MEFAVMRKNGVVSGKNDFVREIVLSYLLTTQVYHSTDPRHEF